MFRKFNVPTKQKPARRFFFLLRCPLHRLGLTIQASSGSILGGKSCLLYPSLSLQMKWSTCPRTHCVGHVSRPQSIHPTIHSRRVVWPCHRVCLAGMCPLKGGVRLIFQRTCQKISAMGIHLRRFPVETHSYIRTALQLIALLNQKVSTDS